MALIDQLNGLVNAGTAALVLAITRELRKLRQDLAAEAERLAEDLKEVRAHNLERD